MTIQRPAFAFSIANVSALIAGVACNVFQPPPGNDGGVMNTRHGSGGSGGAQGSGGDVMMTSGGRDASVSSGGGGAGSGGGAGTSSGSASSTDSGVDSGEPSGPLAPWWPGSVSITYDPKKPAVMCQSEGAPNPSTDRPRKSDPGNSISPIYLAMNRLLLGSVKETPNPMNPSNPVLGPDANAWTNIGFDIDHKCTNSSTCAINDTSYVLEKECTSGMGTSAIPSDGNNCIDNSIGRLFNLAANAPSVGDWFGMTEYDFNCELWRGGFTIIYKISNYNGQYNDNL
ncbi:MAG TPA: hypothetical protein VHU80_24650, partial [Polyangiaceae bacterium]|nr:hypothetical protein [Polyangiaceae bacterium]